MTKKIYKFLLLITFTILLTNSCKMLFEVPIDAETAFNGAQYTVAADLYKEEFEGEQDLLAKARLAERIGDCYKYANQTAQAAEWYQQASGYSDNPFLLYKYGLMLKATEDYKNAIQVFKEFAFSSPADRALARKQIIACENAIEWQKEDSTIKVFNLQDINTNASEYAPIIYKENGLVFTSDRTDANGDKTYGWTGRDFSDLFVSYNKKNEARWLTPQAFGDSLNTAYNEGTVTFTADFKGVYFSHCGSADSDQDEYCKVYYSEEKGVGQWTIPERVFLFEEDSINIIQCHLTPDGKYLYFAADASDSFGDKDLYVAKKTIDGWGTPRNLGPEINTNGKEGSPFIHTDGRLYFASDGHLGMGGLDVFSAEKDGKNWKNVKNLKTPINSPADDFGLIYAPTIQPELIDSIEAIGYFASTRSGGKGNDDIYYFYDEIPKEPEEVIVEVDTPKQNIEVIPEIVIQEYLLKGNVKEQLYEIEGNSKSKKLNKVAIPNAIVEVLGLSFESKIAERIVANAQGNFELLLEPNMEYKITASSSGYFTKSITVNTKVTPSSNPEIIIANLVLDKIVQQQEIVIDNIYYDLNKANIREDAKPVLDELSILLKDNPALIIEFGSHTDSRGTARYNQQLSQERAESVVNYLTSRGIDRRRLQAKGYGESQLVNNCADGVNCTEEEHQQNRRTTFKVVGENFRG